MAVPSNLQGAELWPIKVQGAINRYNVLGDPEVEQFYHAAIEDGRKLEKSISDAQHVLQQKILAYQSRVQTWLKMHLLATDGEFPTPARKPKYIADAITIIQQVQKFQKEGALLIATVIKNITILTTMEQNLIGMVQANLNAVANLLNSVCNWGLPRIPSIPNLLADGMFNWNGFNFSPLSTFVKILTTVPKFSLNFSFSQCTIVNSVLADLTALGVLGSNVPPQVVQYSGNSFGTLSYLPPLSGATLGDNFNPNSSMLGSLPDPSTITNDYSLPPQTYLDNIVSIVPATRGNVIEPSDPDYGDPNVAARQAALRASLVASCNLGQVVASNFDPNTTAEWLLYLNSTRTGRGGVWIPNFQEVYSSLVTPSVNYLLQTPIPWNDATGTVVDAPLAIPLLTTLTQAAPSAQANLLWRLSYIEAALLGYTRNHTWDYGADPSYLSGFTGFDEDYRVTAIDLTTTNTVILGEGTAQFPVPCTFPAAIAANMAIVIAEATANIANDPTFQSSSPQFRFTFSPQAIATKVDRFTQFWREFNDNLIILLAQDPYLLGFVATYSDALDSAVDPLGDPTDYAVIQSDVASRNRMWTPGTPLLNIPVAPVLTVANNSVPTVSDSGWTNPPFALDPAAFLSRPDIQAQPMTVQMAMLRLNLTYAALNTGLQATLTEIATQIATSNNIIAAAQAAQTGFQVESSSTTTFVPAGMTGTAVEFDEIEFDVTGNVDPTPYPYTTFTIQSAGAYAGFGELYWTEGSVPGVLTLIIMQNGDPIYDLTSNDDSVPLQFSFAGNFNAGDIVQVIVNDELADAEILPQSYFGMLQSSPAPGPTIPVVQTDVSKTFTAGEAISALTVVHIAYNETPAVVTPVDPTTVLQVNGNTVIPFADGVVLANVASGANANVATYYGGVYQITTNPVLNWTVGGLLFVGSNGQMTQDYESLISGSTPVQWIICCGRAIATDTFIWEPHIPSKNIGSVGFLLGEVIPQAGPGLIILDNGGLLLQG